MKQIFPYKQVICNIIGIRQIVHVEALWRGREASVDVRSLWDGRCNLWLRMQMMTSGDTCFHWCKLSFKELCNNCILCITCGSFYCDLLHSIAIMIEPCGVWFSIDYICKFCSLFVISCFVFFLDGCNHCFV